MRVGGLASGMDTEAIVKDMMKIKKLPLDKLMQEKTFTEWQYEAFRDTNLALLSLRDSASDLRLESSFNSYSATSSDSDSVTVDTTANAVNGTYQVQVMSVASPAKMHSTLPIVKSTDPLTSVKTYAKSSDQIGTSGTITVKDKDGNALGNPITITATSTYEEVAKQLQDSTIGKVPELRVSFDDTTSRFFISTKGMGADQNFTLQFSDEALAKQVINNGTETSLTTTNATNGSVKFDGIVINDLTSNKTTVNGLTLNLLQVSGEATNVTVQSNPEKPMEMIKKFVESYNETISKIEKQLVEKRYPDFQPLSDEQKKDMSDNEIELWEEKAKSGLLRNDPVLQSAMRDLRRAFMDPVAGIAPGNINVLAEIGINTGSYTEGGKLFIDEDKLSEAMINNPDEVMKLFNSDDAEGNGIGVGDRVYATLNNIVNRLSDKAGNPDNSVDNSNISKKIKQMDEEISRWQDRLANIEDRYWRQFTAMEKALSQMNSQSTWMQQNMFGGA